MVGQRPRGKEQDTARAPADSQPSGAGSGGAIRKRLGKTTLWASRIGKRLPASPPRGRCLPSPSGCAFTASQRCSGSRVVPVPQLCPFLASLSQKQIATTVRYYPSLRPGCRVPTIIHLGIAAGWRCNIFVRPTTAPSTTRLFSRIPRTQL